VANAKTNFRNATSKGLQQKAGEFYERLLAKTLQCKRSPRGQPEYADLYSEKLDARIEVKARGDSNGLALRVSQIERLLLPQPFPTPTDALYAVVPYRSRRGIKPDEKRPKGIGRKTTMVSLFRFLVTDTQYNQCWAANTPIVYVLDIQIVKALRERIGTRLGFYPDRPDREALILNRTNLKKYFQVRDEELEHSLTELGITEPGEFAKATYPMKVRIRVSEPPEAIPKEFSECKFILVTVLQKSTHARVAIQLTHTAITLK
jgi:hypothetical protein